MGLIENVGLGKEGGFNTSLKGWAHATFKFYRSIVAAHVSKGRQGYGAQVMRPTLEAYCAYDCRSTKAHPRALAILVGVGARDGC
jgi:hypothetical protein